MVIVGDNVDVEVRDPERDCEVVVVCVCVTVGVINSGWAQIDVL